MLCKVTHESKHKLVKLIERTLKEINELVKVIMPKYITRYYLYYIDNDGDEISLLNQSDFSIFIETNKQNLHVYVKQQEILETLSNASGVLQDDSLLIDKYSQIDVNLNNSSVFKGLENNKPFHRQHQQQSQSSIKKTNSNTQYSQITSYHNVLNLSSRRQQIHTCSCNRCKSKQIIGFRYQCPFCLNFNLCEICEKIQKHRHPLLQIKQKGQQIIHSQLRDHLNLQIPSKQHNQLIKQLDEQKKINLNLLKLIQQIDKNQEKSKSNYKEGFFKKSLFDDDFFQDQKNRFNKSFEQRSSRKDELFDRFFEKPLIPQNSRLLNRPRYSYMQPTSSYTRTNRTESYYDNF